MVNSGTEATMSAIRLARGYTKREKIVKFTGCYHGHADSFLIAAGSGAVTFGVPNSPGVTEGTAKDTLLAPYNDLDAVKSLVAATKGAENKDKIAAIILEPVAGNMGCVLPRKGFLEGLRTLCDEEGIVLIFDEVMTGFRLARGGAQEHFGIQADLVTLGKIIGGGMPVGAYGGKAEIMNCIAPLGPVYQAGTLSGNPIAMAAGVSMLEQLNECEDLYSRLDAISARLEAEVVPFLEAEGLPYTINRIGSMISIFFNQGQVVDSFERAQESDEKLFSSFFQSMLKRGVYLPPSQYESWFLSYALSDEDVAHLIRSTKESLLEVKASV
jgi:glutamate-1-semialdehyde 2,1-aminomutase